jgi:hypothetical protein
VWGITGFSFIKFLTNFSKDAEGENVKANELYFRLNTIFAKNKYGYNTRFMSDFDLLLESALNERFIDESTNYYDDPVVAVEIQDMEQGLVSEFSQDDIRNLIKDKDSGHHDKHKSLRYPGRVGYNYQKSDDLSIYKVHPNGQKPEY